MLSVAPVALEDLLPLPARSRTTKRRSFRRLRNIVSKRLGNLCQALIVPAIIIQSDNFIMKFLITRKVRVLQPIELALLPVCIHTEVTAVEDDSDSFQPLLYGQF